MIMHILLASESHQIINGGALMMLGSLGYTVQGIRRDGFKKFCHAPWMAIVLMALLGYTAYGLTRLNNELMPKPHRPAGVYQNNVTTNQDGTTMTNLVRAPLHPLLPKVQALQFSASGDGPQWTNCLCTNCPIIWFSNDVNTTEWKSSFDSQTNRHDAVVK